MNFVHLSNYRNCNDICLAPKEIAETELRIFRKIIELQEMGYSVIEQNMMAKLKIFYSESIQMFVYHVDAVAGEK